MIDFDRLNQLTLDRNNKIDNIACWVKQLNAESAAIDNEINALESRKKSKKNKVDSLKNYLSYILNGVKFESARNKISWRVSDEIHILDENQIPDEYKTEKIELYISKADIKKQSKITSPLTARK